MKLIPLFILALALSGCSTIDKFTDGTLETGIFVSIDCKEVQSLHFWGLLTTGSKVRADHAAIISAASCNQALAAAVAAQQRERRP